jgi:hypothetical protein
MEYIIYFKSYIVLYFFTGLLFNFLYDRLIDSNVELQDNRLTWGERFAVMLFWPITLVAFVYHFVKGMLDGE